MPSKIFYSEADRASNLTQMTEPKNGYTEAQTCSEQTVDLNEQLARNQPATFFMKVNSNVLSGAGINKDDMLIVDRSLEPVNGKIVIAVIDGEMLIRKLEINGGKKWLTPVSQKLAPLEMTHSGYQIWGVVTYVIHSL
jgi:DNA polymerase V